MAGLQSFGIPLSGSTKPLERKAGASARTVVAQIERGVRTRWPFRQVHEALREDTDQNAAVLLSHSSFALKNGTATTVLHFVRDLQRKAQESQHA